MDARGSDARRRCSQIRLGWGAGWSRGEECGRVSCVVSRISRAVGCPVALLAIPHYREWGVPWARRGLLVVVNYSYRCELTIAASSLATVYASRGRASCGQGVRAAWNVAEPGVGTRCGAETANRTALPVCGGMLPAGARARGRRRAGATRPVWVAFSLLTIEIWSSRLFLGLQALH